MNAVLLTFTLLALTAGAGRAPATPRARPAREAPALKEDVPSCEGAEVIERDGKYYRVVRGSLVACDPALPPAV